MKSGIFLLLGSNLGRAHEHLDTARRAITEAVGPILKTSSVYRTAAWGKKDQPDFLNQVIEISTSLKPSDLLQTVLEIELRMGRIRDEKWGPRIIDIDILFYHDTVLETESLVLPHPGIPHRKFTLIPLAEIARDFFHPVLKKKIATLLAESDDPSEVAAL